MIKIYQIYIILYLIYLFSSNFITGIFTNKIELVKNKFEFLRRIITLTTLNFLISGYYFYNSNSETYLIALFFSIFIIFAYYFKYKNINDFKRKWIDHSLPLIPLLFYRQNFSNIKFTDYSKSILIISIYYFTVQNIIYY